jgi:hypothetical protein
MERQICRVRLIVALVSTLVTLSAFTVTPTMGGILFAAGSKVPPSVRAFAWHVIETRCDFQSHELQQRSFWAYDTRARTVDGAVVYSMSILSELSWKKSEPPVTLDIAVADDGGRLRLRGLTSSLIRCSP